MLHREVTALQQTGTRNEGSTAGTTPSQDRKSPGDPARHQKPEKLPTQQTRVAGGSVRLGPLTMRLDTEMLAAWVSSLGCAGPGHF